LAINSLLVSVSIWNRWLEVEPFRFHVNCIHFRRAFFVHVGSTQLSTENGVSFYMCSVVEVAWLEQNIRHSKQYTYVIASAVAFRCLWLIISLVHI